MAQQFVKPKVATEAVVNNPSLKMDSSVETNLLRTEKPRKMS